MTTRHVLIPPSPPGAGRISHEIWPNQRLNRTNGALAGANVTDGTTRQGIHSAGVAAAVLGGASGSLTIAGIYRGAIPVRVRNLVAGDIADLQFVSEFFPAVEQQAQTDVGNPVRVYSLKCHVAFPVLGGALGAAADLGLELRPGNVASMNNGANRPGVMFGPVSATHLAFRGRPGFAAPYAFDQQFPFAAAGLVDVADFAVWELRVIAADSRGPAVIKALINNRQVGVSVLMNAAAALAPLPDAAGGGFNGYHWRFINTNTGNYDAMLNEAHILRAPDEASLT